MCTFDFTFYTHCKHKVKTQVFCYYHQHPEYMSRHAPDCPSGSHSDHSGHCERYTTPPTSPPAKWIVTSTSTSTSTSTESPPSTQLKAMISTRPRPPETPPVSPQAKAKKFSPKAKAKIKSSPFPGYPYEPPPKRHSPPAPPLPPHTAPLISATPALATHYLPPLPPRRLKRDNPDPSTLSLPRPKSLSHKRSKSASLSLSIPPPSLSTPSLSSPSSSASSRSSSSPRSSKARKVLDPATILRMEVPYDAPPRKCEAWHLRPRPGLDVAVRRGVFTRVEGLCAGCADLRSWWALQGEDGEGDEGGEGGEDGEDGGKEGGDGRMELDGTGRKEAKDVEGKRSQEQEGECEEDDERDGNGEGEGKEGIKKKKRRKTEAVERVASVEIDAEKLREQPGGSRKVDVVVEEKKCETEEESHDKLINREAVDMRRLVRKSKSEKFAIASTEAMTEAGDKISTSLNELILDWMANQATAEHNIFEKPNAEEEGRQRERQSRQTPSRLSIQRPDQKHKESTSVIEDSPTARTREARTLQPSPLQPTLKPNAMNKHEFL